MWNQGFPINWNAPLNRGLLSWWLRTPTLVSNARFLDVCGKGHGVITGNPIWSGGTRPGAWGALTFDGTDYITPDLPTRFEFGAGDWTAVAHVKPTNVTVDRVIWAKTGTTTAWETGAKAWYLKATTGVQVLDAYGMTPPVSTTGVSMGVWSHVAVTFTNSSDTATFYLNGRPDGAVAFLASPVADNAAHVVRLGAFSSGLEIPMLGSMDDIRLYNRVLSAEEIMRLYQVSRTGYQFELNWLEDDDDYRRPTIRRAPQLATAPYRHAS